MLAQSTGNKKSLQKRLLVIGFAFALCISPGISIAQSLIVDDVAIYDVLAGEFVVGHTVIIVDGVISRISIGPDNDMPDAATRVPGTGLTMLPGLTDAHVHMTARDTGTFLANGVTSVRELNGSRDHLQLRDDIARGHTLGPRMLVSSPLLSGRKIDFRHRVLETPADAERLVKEFHQAGYDYLKVYDDLDANTYQQLVATAQSLDLPLVGHVPMAVGLDGVLAAQQAIEHNEKIVVDVLGHDFVDAERLRESARAIAASGVAVTPTLAVHGFLDNRHGSTTQNRMDSAIINYVDGEILAWWQSIFTPTEDDKVSHQDSVASDFLKSQRFLLREMARLGVPILAGTDTPNPLMVPGFGLHDELDALTRAGLSNAAAIRAATSTAGAQLSWPVAIGAVREGYAADLILVRGNPADDISVLRNPVGVIVGGVWLNEQELQDLLDDARRN